MSKDDAKPSTRTKAQEASATAAHTAADSGAATVVPTPAPAAPQPPAPDEHTGKGGLYIRSGGQRTLVDRTKQPPEATTKE